MFFSAIGERVAVDAIRLAPKQLYSNAVGWAARRRVPPAVRGPAYAAWARAFGVALGEVEFPLDRYESFGSFFARGLKDGARPLDPAADVIMSPCDGRILEAGSIDGDMLLTAKGRTYRISALLANDGLARDLDGGSFVTIYLSPRDYHRVHAPIASSLVGYAHVPGALWPVSPFFTERVDSLLALNERLVLEFAAEFGGYAMVMVGAAGVGNMTLSRPRLESRHLRGSRDIRRVELPDALACARGDEVGAFELGSTVVLALPRTAGAEICVDVGESVRFGQRLLTRTGSKGAA